MRVTQIAVISGGGTGIGFATARYFAERHAQVVIIGRRRAALEAAAKALRQHAPQAPNIVTLTADLAVVDDVMAVRADLTARFDAIDVLVNAAGGHVLRQAPPDAYSDDLAGVARRWTDNFRNNTLTAALLTEAVVPHMRVPGGRIIFLSSIAAYRGSNEGSYGAAKAALHPYCFDLAKALGPRGITVNAIAPGYVANTEFFGAAMNEALHEAKTKESLNHRAGTPEDIAATVGWLASPEAVHVTGGCPRAAGAD
jgi:3-oxoacyl-[acyl-carrier protein] reductase